MGGFLDVNLPSEDEEDEDFVPVDSDEERLKAANKRKRRRGASGPSEADADGEEGYVGPSAPVAPTRTQEERASRIEAIWADLRHASAPQASTSGRTYSSLADLCKTVKSKTLTENPADWRRQLGYGRPLPATSSGPASQDRLAQAEHALNLARTAGSAAVAARQGLQVVHETRRFAGEEIKVQTLVPAAAGDGDRVKEEGAPSKEVAAAASAAEGPAKAGGLDSMLASMTQTKKITIMDKSRADWGELKQADGELEDELEKHKRSGGQYLDKQDFLKAAELRQYEQDRDRRLRGDVRARGRL